MSRWTNNRRLLTDQQEAILAVIRSQHGTPINAATIASIIGTEAQPASIKVQVHKMRAVGVKIKSKGRGRGSGGYWIEVAA